MEYKKELEDYKSKGYNLIYMDESGFMKDIAREYGYSKKGEKLYSFREYYETKRTNFVGAYFNKKIISPMLTSSNIDSDMFFTWVTEFFLADLKELKGPNVLILDNASFHKRMDTIKILQENSCEVLFLPPYSPEFNPIEKAWANLKKKVQQFRCSVEELYSKYYHEIDWI